MEEHTNEEFPLLIDIVIMIMMLTSELPTQLSLLELVDLLRYLFHLFLDIVLGFMKCPFVLQETYRRSALDSSQCSAEAKYATFSIWWLCRNPPLVIQRDQSVCITH